MEELARKFNLSLDVLEWSSFQKNEPLTRYDTRPDVKKASDRKIHVSDYKKEPEILLEQIQQLKRKLNEITDDKKQLTVKVISLEKELKQERSQSLQTTDSPRHNRVKSAYSVLRARDSTEKETMSKTTAATLLDRNRRLEKELNELKHGLKYTNIIELETSLKTYYQEITRLKRLLAHAQHNVNFTTTHNPKLSEYASSITSLHKEKTELSAVDDLQSQLDAIRKENNDMTEEIKKWKYDYQQLEDKHNESQQKLDLMQQSAQSSQQDLERSLSTESQVQASMERISSHSQLVQDLTRNLYENISFHQLGVMEKLELVLKALETSEKQLSDSKTEKTNLARLKQGTSKHTAIEFLEITDVNAEKNSLTTQLKLMETELLQYKSSFERTVKLNVDLNQQLSDIQEEMIKMQRQMKSSASIFTSGTRSMNARDSELGNKSYIRAVDSELGNKSSIRNPDVEVGNKSFIRNVDHTADAYSIKQMIPSATRESSVYQYLTFIPTDQDEPMLTHVKDMLAKTTLPVEATHPSGDSIATQESDLIFSRSSSPKLEVEAQERNFIATSQPLVQSLKLPSTHLEPNTDKTESKTSIQEQETRQLKDGFEIKRAQSVSTQSVRSFEIKRSHSGSAQSEHSSQIKRSHSGLMQSGSSFEIKTSHSGSARSEHSAEFKSSQSGSAQPDKSSTNTASHPSSLSSRGSIAGAHKAQTLSRSPSTRSIPQEKPMGHSSLPHIHQPNPQLSRSNSSQHIIKSGRTTPIFNRATPNLSRSSSRNSISHPTPTRQPTTDGSIQKTNTSGTLTPRRLDPMPNRPSITRSESTKTDLGSTDATSQRTGLSRATQSQTNSSRNNNNPISASEVDGPTETDYSGTDSDQYSACTETSESS